ncbi:MAG: hypothetical protein AMXMBFR84_35190 [Candidatus Hydrogenedentota bacterium]
MATWKTVRVFISSTFRDMHAERDYLVKVVFPRLRERLDPHRIHLVDIDLRWGITEEEAEDNRVLDLCLQQIDTCRPFFIGILGERYGWVPGAFDESALSKYGWIQHATGKSLTELEILHGVLRNPEMRSHAFFYFRNPAFIDDVPVTKRSDLRPENAESKDKLLSLREAIRQTPLSYPPMENYPCRYAGLRINWRLASQNLTQADRDVLHTLAVDGVVDSTEYAALDDRLRSVIDQNSHVLLTGLEIFGNRVFDQLWSGIKFEYELPDTPSIHTLRERDPLAEDQEYHERFMESRTRVYIGRENIQQQLFAVASNDDTYPCLVTGPAGSGKSAILAKFATDYLAAHPDVLVIPHFVGASPGSTSLMHMLRRFCLILGDTFAIKHVQTQEESEQWQVPAEVPFEPIELASRFRDYLNRVPGEKRVVFVIDALNQLDETDNAHALHWLPREWPTHVKCIASCTAHEDNNPVVLAAFKGRRTHIIRVPTLTDEERLAIVTEVPSLSAKRLSSSQVRLLLDNPATKNPLLLLVALEELRGFGSFDQLNARIAALPRDGDTVTAIFTQVIERLEEEFDARQVRKVLSWLACARSGLSGRELLELLEGIGASESRSDLYPILRQIRAYLQHRGELFDFYHGSFRDAVAGKYGAHAGAQVLHAELAAYFLAVADPGGNRSWTGQSAHSINELPFHLYSSCAYETLAAVLGDTMFAAAKSTGGAVYDLLTDYQTAILSFSSEGSDQTRLVQLASILRRFAHGLHNAPECSLQQILIGIAALESPDTCLEMQGNVIANEHARTGPVKLTSFIPLHMTTGVARIPADNDRVVENSVLRQASILLRYRGGEWTEFSSDFEVLGMGSTNSATMSTMVAGTQALVMCSANVAQIYRYWPVGQPLKHRCTHPITTAACSTDDRFVLLGCADGALELLILEDDGRVTIESNQLGTMVVASWFDSGGVAVAVTRNGSIHYLRCDSHTVTYSAQTPHPCAAACGAWQGKACLLSEDNHLFVRRLNAELVWEDMLPTRAYSLAFAAKTADSAATIVSGLEDGNLQVRDAESGKLQETIQVSHTALQHVEIAQAGNLILCRDSAHNVYVISPRRGDDVARFRSWPFCGHILDTHWNARLRRLSVVTADGEPLIIHESGHSGTNWNISHAPKLAARLDDASFAPDGSITALHREPGVSQVWRHSPVGNNGSTPGRTPETAIAFRSRRLWSGHVARLSQPQWLKIVKVSRSGNAFAMYSNAGLISWGRFRLWGIRPHWEKWPNPIDEFAISDRGTVIVLTQQTGTAIDKPPARLLLCKGFKHTLLKDGWGGGTRGIERGMAKQLRGISISCDGRIITAIDLAHNLWVFNFEPDRPDDPPSGDIVLSNVVACETSSSGVFFAALHLDMTIQVLSREMKACPQNLGKLLLPGQANHFRIDETARCLIVSGHNYVQSVRF